MSKKSLRLPISQVVSDRLLEAIPSEFDNNDKNNGLAQVMHSLLGTVSPEVAGRSKLPIEKGCGRYTHYNRFHGTKRAQEKFRVDWWHATRIAELAIQDLKNSQFGVNQVRLLLDTQYSKKDRDSAFNHLKTSLQLDNSRLEYQPPSTATLAIALGLIPAPDTSWQNRFMVAAKGYLTQASVAKNLISHVNTHECFLWVFPPARAEETHSAISNQYFSDVPAPSAIMGMGFAIIESPWRRPYQSSPVGYIDQYSIYTPLWQYRAGDRTNEGQNRSWKPGLILYSTLREGAPNASKLAELLPSGLHSLPRIHGCDVCNTLFISDHAGFPDVPIECKCSNPTHMKEASS
ncbi:hypothetical protein [Marinobacterium sp. BA1]|uniref:hypothetical protein n=1 Tax=Marinobacterium sp. BA1 TaxID=3138931 RepID=UPI0034E891AF